MKMRRLFDAVVDFPPRGTVGKGERVIVALGGERAKATLTPLSAETEPPGSSFVHIAADLPSPVMWKDEFEILEPGGKRAGTGLALHPAAPEPKTRADDHRLALLRRLRGDAGEMLLALAEERGIHGLREEDLAAVARVPAKTLEPLVRELETDGRIRILSFAPLFFVTRSALGYLEERVLDFVGQYHERTPGERGAPREKVPKRVARSGPVQRLARSGLAPRGQHIAAEDHLRLPGVRIPLRPEEEKALEDLEQMCYRGEFYTMSLDEIRSRFGLTPSRLQTLLAVLAERKKIIQGKDGFYIHAQWLDEVIAKVRAHPGRELAVADFKALTGLSRKFAIPLLELLDELGVTRRVGPSREILRPPSRP
jgi:selenocysteine-specific elongation factor